MNLRTFTIGAILALTFGIIANANADHILWASTGNTNINGGGRIYTINPVTGSVTLVGNTGLDKLDALAFDNSGNLYGVSGGSQGPANLYTLSTLNASPMFVGTATATNLNGIGAIAFDSSGTLFGGGWFLGRLLTLNPGTASVITDIAMIGSGNAFAAGLAFDPTGQLFGSRGNSGGHLEDLVSIDTGTGVQTNIGIATNIISDIAFTRDGTLYGGSPLGGGGGGGPAGSALFTIDPTSGDKTLLIADTGIRISGLTTHDNPTPTGGTPVKGPNGNFYEFVASNKISWDAAHTEATNLTFLGVVGHLATITSMEEDDFIETARQAVVPDIFEVWVGGFQNPATTPGPGDNWTWVNGEGTFPGDNLGPEYANWGLGEPNDFHTTASEQHLAVGLGDFQQWNDEGGPGVDNITGFVVEYDVSTVFVEPDGENPVLFFAQADQPDSDNPLTAGFPEILPGGGGSVSISCCRVLDNVREGLGTGGPRFGDYLPLDFDLGDAVGDTDLNPSCVDMPLILSGTALMHPWQRGVPTSAGIDDPDNDLVAREHDIGVCVIESDVIAKGAAFSAEEAANVLGYSLDCGVETLVNRGFTAAGTTSGAGVPSYLARISADCDGSRSAKRYSDTVLALNVWHYAKHLPTRGYLKQLSAAAKTSIEDIRLTGCVDNSEFILDNLKSFVRIAEKEFGKNGDADTAIEALDDATRLALLIDPVPMSDPYSSTPPCDAINAQGLFVGQYMALKFATCSEKKFPGPGQNSDSGNGNCRIEDDIFAEMPPLPGFPNPPPP